MMLAGAEGSSGRYFGQARTYAPSLLNFCLLSEADGPGGILENFSKLQANRERQDKAGDRDGMILC
jgi:hypothetical protein